MGCICPTPEKHDDESSSHYIQVKSYVGEKNCCGQRHGNGQYYYDNGDLYDGQWKRNKKHGYGKYTFADGDCRTGYFQNDDYYGKAPPPGMSSLHETSSPNPPLTARVASQPQVPPPVEQEQAAYTAVVQQRLREAELRKQERSRNRAAKIANLKQKYNIVS